MMPMAKIKEYKVISVYTGKQQFEDAVNMAITDGWFILGSPQVCYNPQEGMVFTQALIKLEAK